MSGVRLRIRETPMTKFKTIDKDRGDSLDLQHHTETVIIAALIGRSGIAA